MMTMCDGNDGQCDNDDGVMMTMAFDVIITMTNCDDDEDD